MAQEKYDPSYTKSIQKAHADLRIERWVKIAFWRDTDQGKEMILLHDLPAKVWEKRKWATKWRWAKLICLYPKSNVTYTIGNYDHKSGESLEINSCLSQLIAAKAQVTRQENEIRKYITAHENELFFDPSNDPQLNKVKDKLNRKKQQLKVVENRFKKLQTQSMT